MLDYRYYITEDGADLGIAIRPKHFLLGNHFQSEDEGLINIVYGDDIMDILERNDLRIRV